MTDYPSPLITPPPATTDATGFIAACRDGLHSLTEFYDDDSYFIFHGVPVDVALLFTVNI